MKKRLVRKTKKHFAGSYIVLLILLCFGIIPGLIYFLVRQGEKEYVYEE